MAVVVRLAYFVCMRKLMAIQTCFGFGIGCVDTDYRRVQVEICACIHYQVHEATLLGALLAH